MKKRLLRLIRPVRATAVVATAMLSVVIAISACSSKSSLVGAGGECFLATDCAPGLICLPQQNKASVCSSDLSSVAGKPPPEGGVADAEIADGEGGSQTDSPVTPQDTGTDTNTTQPDTSTPPPVDSGKD